MTGKGQSGTLPGLGTASESDKEKRAATQPNLPAQALKTPPPRAAQSEVAGYIEVLAAEMRHMAHTARLESLAYFLEMARLEASVQARKPARCGGEPAG